MAAPSPILTLFNVLGGLAVFLLGMGMMTDGLRQAAAQQLRRLLMRATRRRVTGVGLGTLMGFLVHSSGATVMYVGFVNAGLLTLAAVVPLILGANVGTTLSMQLISFKIGDYCFIAIALGFLLRVAAPWERARHLGAALLGFGLLFLGMTTMSGALEPHREALAPLLARIDGRTVGGMLLGVLLATAVTGVVQSSGATIGMCFALAQAGAFAGLEQVYPIILGAHLGTCVTALLASLGTTLDARRCAVVHLFFNLGNVVFAILAAPLFLAVIPRLTPDQLTRQIANLHLGIMLVAALLVLPFSGLVARLVQRLVRSRHPQPQPSHLDRALLDRPETAIAAMLRELQRLATICRQSLRHNAHLFFRQDRRHVRAIKQNEKILDEIKLEMRAYATELTDRYLSRRQAILLEDLDRCVVHLERIGDHLDAVGDCSIRRFREREAFFDKPTIDCLFRLFHDLDALLAKVAESLDPELSFPAPAVKEIRRLRDVFDTHADECADQYLAKVADHEYPPIVGLYLSEYLTSFQRLANHAENIAAEEERTEFHIKHRKLSREARPAKTFERPPPVDPEPYLEGLHPAPR